MQRSGRLLNFTANQDASAASAGASVLLAPLHFLIWFSFAQLPKKEGGGGGWGGAVGVGPLSKVSLGKNTAERQCGAQEAASGVSLASQRKVVGGLVPLT